MAAVDPQLTEALQRLAVGHRILAMEGHNDITLGHLSLRDPQGRGLWLKKAKRGLDEIFGADDFVLIDFDGKLIQSDGPLHSEWPIHAEIMKARSDVNVVGHTHAYAFLSDGFVEGFEIVCPLHSGSFDVRTGEPKAPPCDEPIDVFPCRIENGDVYVKIDAGAG